MKLIVAKGRTNLMIKLFIQDSSKTDGSGLTGLTSSTSGLVCRRARDDDGNTGGITIGLSSATLGTYTSGGFVEKDATNMPGIYEFGVPSTATASGSETCVMMFRGAANMVPCVVELQLTAFDPQDAVRAGLTALPNAAASANGGLPILGTNASAISFTAGFTISNTSGNALTLTSSSANGHGLSATGATGGHGINAAGGATSGSGINAQGGGSGPGIGATGGSSGPGIG